MHWKWWCTVCGDALQVVLYWRLWCTAGCDALEVVMCWSGDALEVVSHCSWCCTAGGHALQVVIDHWSCTASGGNITVFMKYWHILAFNWPVKPESFQSTKFLIVCHITAFLCILCIQECFHVYLTPISSSFFTKFALSKYPVIYCLISCGSKKISLMGVTDFFTYLTLSHTWTSHLPLLTWPSYLNKLPSRHTYIPVIATFPCYLLLIALNTYLKYFLLIGLSFGFAGGEY